MPIYHPNKTPASNALTDLIRTILRMNPVVQRSGSQLMEGTGLSNARWQMLSELHSFAERVTVSQLARHMGLTRQAVQRLADEMADEGIVEFVPNPNDQRAMHVAMTEIGETTYRDSLEREWQWTNTIAEGLDPTEIAKAEALLEVITEKMKRDI